MKVQKISGFQHQFSFNFIENDYESFKQRFLESDLCKIYQAIPWDNLVKAFKLKYHSKGPDGYFDSRGKIALMFLKHYTGVSDRKLIEQINGNIEYQFFCGIFLGKQRLTNYKIVSQIRVELSKKLDIEKTQQLFYNKWKKLISNPEQITVDATCYESEVRYPTNVKLLWESINWLHNELKIISKYYKIKMMRSKYSKWKPRYISYSKMRRKTKKKRNALTRSLLLLIEKYNNELDRIEKQYAIEMPDRYYNRRAIIKKVYRQQYDLFHKGILPKNRIVSLSKDYVRPIVRGKEIKKVEFGAKVNKFQIDGINFIEHISFDNFNEGTRYINTVLTAQILTKRKTRVTGADAIYATNKNRVFATAKGILTDFKPKGKPSKYHKQKKQAASIITKERATRLEGSFGKEKEHYLLRKVKAKTEKTEILWIFFGIHTANALEIGRRMTKSKLKASA